MLPASSNTPFLPSQPRLFRTEEEHNKEFYRIVTLFVVAAICALATVGGFFTALYLQANQTILLTVGVVGSLGTIGSFSFAVYLVEKGEEESKSRLRAVNKGFDDDRRLDADRRAQIDTFPSKEEVLEDLSHLSFKEWAQKDYDICEAFEKGYISYNNLLLKEKLARFLKEASLGNLCGYCPVNHLPFLVPEACRDRIIDLVARYSNLLNKEHQLNTEERNAKRHLRKEYDQKINTLRQQKRALLTPFQSGLSTSPLNGEHLLIDLEMQTLKRANSIRIQQIHAKYEAARIQHNALKDQQLPILEAEWDSLKIEMEDTL